MNKILQKILDQGNKTHPTKDIADYKLDEEKSNFEGLDGELKFKLKRFVDPVDTRDIPQEKTKHYPNKEYCNVCGLELDSDRHCHRCFPY